MPGKPDIVIDKYRFCIFVNGCFWYHHYHCRLATMPKTNKDYWAKKIDRNVANDVKHYRQLEQLNYRVLTVWECELKDAFELTMTTLIDEIKEDDNT